MFEPKGIALAIALVVAFGAAVKWGDSIGETRVRKEVAEERLSTSQKINDLQADLLAASAVHAKEMQEIRDEWSKSELDHLSNVAGIHAEYAGRLQLSEKRADVYQRQARGSTIEQDRLAKHAAELDRTLEEGRSLVRELREAIGQRDSAIRALGSMILTDRKFFSAE